ncbi:DNA alkylation repair protein [Actinoallomurus bryophytorum]|uniref:3-methyladenine DNA glycosylase AlkD n=1 Tax=Actinoallomurus bryophytorum TaxID=1490222 RepID=A0A543CM24_9ACTN|nr:DNA alkylation repair protein [Actinoallomurus bryophytorum]TQL98164.1 3-methyladenine DNA glycosylase AlkD [Actinoallomurus bryophytorum]
MTAAGEIEARLGELADPVRAEQDKRYLKSDLRHLGVGLPALRGVAVAAAKGLDRERTLALVEELWHEPVHEHRMAAIEVLIRNTPLLTATDLAVAERLIRASRTWAYVDALAVKVVGGLVTRYPPLAATLDTWAGDDDFWIRRTSLLALLPGIRSGGPDLDRLSRHGDALIGEREFFIRKALGWVLRELARSDPAWVTTWVRDRVAVVSGVTIREAVRHLPEKDREDLLAAYRAR